MMPTLPQVPSVDMCCRGLSQGKPLHVHAPSSEAYGAPAIVYRSAPRRDGAVSVILYSCRGRQPVRVARCARSLRRLVLSSRRASPPDIRLAVGRFRLCSSPDISPVARRS